MRIELRGRNEALEQRVWLVGFAAKLGMKLAADKERMVWQLDDLDQFSVGSVSAENEI